MTAHRLHSKGSGKKKRTSRVSGPNLQAAWATQRDRTTVRGRSSQRSRRCPSRCDRGLWSVCDPNSADCMQLWATIGYLREKTRRLQESFVEIGSGVPVPSLHPTRRNNDICKVEGAVFMQVQCTLCYQQEMKPEPHTAARSMSLAGLGAWRGATGGGAPGSTAESRGGMKRPPAAMDPMQSGPKDA